MSQLFLGATTFAEDFDHGARVDEARRIVDTYADAGAGVFDTPSNYRAQLAAPPTHRTATLGHLIRARPGGCGPAPACLRARPPLVSAPVVDRWSGHESATPPPDYEDAGLGLFGISP